jgi:phage gp45-like
MNPTDNTLVRTKLTKTDDSGKQQTLQLTGRKKEVLGGQKKGIVRVQHYGFTNHAPKGSLGITLIMNGNPDQTLVIGIEHPDHRPTNLKEGEAEMYDDQGQYILIARDRIYVKTPKDVMVEAGGKVDIVATGNIKLKSDKDIILEPGGVIKLGGDDATRPVSALGTIDTGGFADQTNELTKVLGK